MRSFKDFIISSVLLALALSMAKAYDPSPMQDYCVATNETDGVFVNGKFCKDPALVKTSDFTFSGLNVPGATANPLGLKFTTKSIDELPALNTLGISLSRADYAPDGGLNAPHTHPRAAEIFHVLQGKLYVAFVTGEGYNYTLFERILSEGEGMVFPYGMPHFQMNIGKKPGVAFSAYNSQSPGFIEFSDALFRSKPSINSSILAKAFKISKKLVEALQS